MIYNPRPIKPNWRDIPEVIALGLTAGLVIIGGCAVVAVVTIATGLVNPGLPVATVCGP